MCLKTRLYSIYRRCGKIHWAIVSVSSMVPVVLRCGAVAITIASTTACSGSIWLGAMLLRLELALAGNGLPVDSLFCFSSPVLHWLPFLQTLHSSKSCQWGKIACTASITDSAIVGILSFVNSLFCYAWLGHTTLFQLQTESVILVVCSYFASCGRHLHMQYSNWFPFCMTLRQNSGCCLVITLTLFNKLTLDKTFAVLLKTLKKANV